MSDGNMGNTIENGDTSSEGVVREQTNEGAILADVMRRAMDVLQAAGGADKSKGETYLDSHVPASFQYQPTQIPDRYIDQLRARYAYWSTLNNPTARVNAQILLKRITEVES